jgi:hypothetical protein
MTSYKAQRAKRICQRDAFLLKAPVPCPDGIDKCVVHL